MNKLNQIFIETLKVSPEDAASNLGMDDVRNWDSLSHMNLIVTIENDFGIVHFNPLRKDLNTPEKSSKTPNLPHHHTKQFLWNPKNVN